MSPNTAPAINYSNSPNFEFHGKYGGISPFIPTLGVKNIWAPISSPSSSGSNFSLVPSPNWSNMKNSSSCKVNNMIVDYALQIQKIKETSSSRNPRPVEKILLQLKPKVAKKPGFMPTKRLYSS